MKIAVIEDDVGLGFLQKDILESKGHRVINWYNAMEVIVNLDHVKPDLLILDYSLPDMNGRELIIELRDKHRMIPPFLCATGRGDEKIAVEMMKLGARDYIVKDSNFLDLLPEVVMRIVNDISRDDELRRIQNMHRNLFDSISFELFYVDSNFTIQMVNSQLQRSYKCEESFFIGRKCHHFFGTCQDCVCDNCPGILTLTDGKPHEELIHRKQADKEVTKLIRSFPVQNRGIINGFILMSEDITEKLNIENELRHARKMESLGQLSGGIAHDFNNLLTGIMGAVEVIRDTDEFSKDAKEFLDIIFQTSLRAADLTSKLLLFSRKSKKELKTIDLHELLNQTKTLLERSVNKKINILADFSADSSLLYCDSSQLQNVILNMGINASHAMTTDGTLKFSTRNVSYKAEEVNEISDLVKSGRYIELNIEDDGCGIHPENLKRIFEPFFTTKKEGEGTGLGLSAAYGIIKEHNGFIKVESDHGVGTTFKILLPIYECMEEEKENCSESTRGQGTILLADDEEIVRITLQKILEYLGYKVITTKNGAEAINVFKQKRESIDIIILDMTMPIMDGKEAFKHIRDIDQEISVIILTGYINEHTLKLMRNIGNFSLVNKPFQKDELSKILSELLNKNSKEIDVNSNLNKT